MSSKNPGNKNTLLKVIILGDGGVGKSCLMNRFVNNQFDERSFHTIGVEFLTKELKISNDLYTLQIWDTAGQEKFKSLRTPFYRGSDICLLTFAVDDMNSFKNLSVWKNEFLYYADIKDGKAFPFIVVANKVDIPAESRKVPCDAAQNWCHENGILPYVETSAKDAINVDQAFSLAVEIWSRLEAEMDEKTLYHDNGIKLSRRSDSRRDSCCRFT